MKKTFFVVAVLLLAACGKSNSPAPSAQPAKAPTFASIQSSVLPKCTTCHNSMTTYEAVRQMVTPGDPAASLFYRVVAEGRMPKNGPPLPAEDVQLIGEWIKLGAPNS